MCVCMCACLCVCVRVRVRVRVCLAGLLTHVRAAGARRRRSEERLALLLCRGTADPGSAAVPRRCRGRRRTAREGSTVTAWAQPPPVLGPQPACATGGEERPGRTGGWRGKGGGGAFSLCAGRARGSWAALSCVEKLEREADATRFPQNTSELTTSDRNGGGGGGAGQSSTGSCSGRCPSRWRCGASRSTSSRASGSGPPSATTCGRPCARGCRPSSTTSSPSTRTRPRRAAPRAHTHMHRHV